MISTAVICAGAPDGYLIGSPVTVVPVERIVRTPGDAMACGCAGAAFWAAAGPSQHGQHRADDEGAQRSRIEANRGGRHGGSVQPARAVSIRPDRFTWVMAGLVPATPMLGAQLCHVKRVAGTSPAMTLKLWKPRRRRTPYFASLK